MKVSRGTLSLAITISSFYYRLDHRFFEVSATTPQQQQQDDRRISSNYSSSMLVGVQTSTSFSPSITSKYYFCLNKSKRSWHSHLSNAKALGGSLASIHCEDQNDDVYFNLVMKNMPSAILAYIGFNDIDKEGDFVWSDGSGVTYTNWPPTEPNNCCGGEDCVNLSMSGSNTKWNDLSCEQSWPAVYKLPTQPDGMACIPVIPCVSDTKIPTSTPTTSSIPTLTIRPSSAPSLSESPSNAPSPCIGLNVYVEIKTDQWAQNDNNHFTITDTYTGNIVETEDINEISTTYHFNSCFPTSEYSCYVFKLNDNYGDGLSSTGSIYITVDGNKVADIKGDQFEKQFKLFLNECKSPSPSISPAPTITSSPSITSKYYFCLNKSKRSWHSHLSNAKALGGSLASIHCEDQNDDMYFNLLMKNMPSAGRTYIGFNDINKEGNFVWSDGSGVTYTNWPPTEPNNCCGGEDCVHLSIPGSNTKWNDIYCKQSWPAVYKLPTQPDGMACIPVIPCVSDTKIPTSTPTGTPSGTPSQRPSVSRMTKKSSVKSVKNAKNTKQSKKSNKS